MRSVWSTIRESAHLVARFFDVVTARRLSPAEQDEVAALLDHQVERDAFWDQPVPDQRHGLGAARFVGRREPGRRDLARAALLHDVGKRHARLGVVGRSLASTARLLRRRVRGRFAAYLDHGRLAADELEKAGAGRLVIEYARHHHGSRPDGITPADWTLLQSADRARR